MNKPNSTRMFRGDEVFISKGCMRNLIAEAFREQERITVTDLSDRFVEMIITQVQVTQMVSQAKGV